MDENEIEETDVVGIDAEFGVYPAAVDGLGLYEYDIIGGGVTITKFLALNSPENIIEKVTVPEFIDGYPVKAIGDRAFYDFKYIQEIVLPIYLLTIV